MSKFYFFTWLRWATRVSICSTLLALLISTIITVLIYFTSTQPSLDREVLNALGDILRFWFPIAWSLTLLISLFRSIKYIFNRCTFGYEFQLYSCDGKERIENIGYGNLLKVWRKWFMLNIWLVGSLMIIAIAYTYLFTSFNALFEWFNIYWLSIFLLISGYFSFVILGVKCKQVRISKC